MKTQILTSLAAAVLITAAACTRDDNAAADNTPVAARITAAMADGAVATPAAKAGEPATRADNDLWTQDHIGVMVTDAPKSDMETMYRNVQYATTSVTATAAFSPVAPGGHIYFQQSGETVTFAAYAPYQPSATPDVLPGPQTDGIIPASTASQSTAEARRAIDFLFATGATAHSQAPDVAFTQSTGGSDHSFHHRMTRIVLKLQTSTLDGFAAGDISNATAIHLGGLVHAGTFNVTTGTAQADATPATNDWNLIGNTLETANQAGTQRIFELILFPQTIAPLPLTVTLGGTAYKNTTDIIPAAGPALEAGKSYEFTVTVKKTALQVSGSTITDWSDGGSIHGDATVE